MQNKFILHSEHFLGLFDFTQYLYIYPNYFLRSTIFAFYIINLGGTTQNIWVPYLLFYPIIDTFSTQENLQWVFTQNENI